MACKMVFIKEQFFIDNKNFVEMLDPYDINKQTKRNYVFLNITYRSNNIFVPLKTEVFPNQPFGIIGYSVPTKDKPNAGLDFRKILVINDLTYIEYPKYCKIPKSQQIIINQNFETIENMVVKYIEKYMKSALKQREKLDKLFIYSTLHNFHKELGIGKSKIEKNKPQQKQFEVREEITKALNEAVVTREGQTD